MKEGVEMSDGTLFDSENETYLVGKVITTFFENPGNFYKVMLIKISETNSDFSEKEVVVTGSFGQMQEEESYRFSGNFIDHPRYGKQFNVVSYQQEKPSSTAGLVAYLSSDKFQGIGKKTAQNIVDLLGEKAIDQIIEAPDCLKKVVGLNEKKRAMIVENLRLNYGMEQIVVELNQYGFGNQLAFAIYQLYKEETMNIIQENPYQLVEDIDGIGFKRADNLADQLGYAADSPARIRAAILYEILTTCLSSGDTYIEAENLLQKVIQTLESSRPYEMIPEKVADEIIHLTEAGKIQQEGTRIFENSLYFSEWGIGTGIQRLLSRKKEISYSEKEIEKTLRLLEKKSAISFGTSQIEAMKEAIRSPLFILTGGPGTGKTTVINGIVSLFAELNGLSLDPKDYSQAIFPVLLAAPTGRAAKRMNDTTGLPSGTIHRLLGLTGREKNTSVSASELEGGLLIVDEMSMLDTWLANTLIKAIPTNMQVIFVGDKDQLPSVGPGQVLHDLLEIEAIPKKELTEIYRQDNDSSIIPLAHKIKNGEFPRDFTQNQKDRSFFRSDAYQIEAIIRQVVTKAKNKGFTAQDIQVLAPMYRGVAGIDALNKMMQEIFNPNPEKTKKEVVWNDKIYRIGDKVLQLVNSPENNVFNGDMGEITGIIYAKESDDNVDELIIQFDGGEVSYRRNEWNKITLSYCCSIHKAQGSEFKMVILPMVRQYRRMLQRNLLYTAVTRSKELLILVGEEEAFSTCVIHQSANRRTTLTERIEQADNMTVSTRRQLEAYEEGLGKEAKEELTVEKTAATKAERAGSSITSQSTSKTSEKIVPAKKRIAKSEDVEAISLFPSFAEREEQEEQPKSYILTMEMVKRQTISPLVGLDPDESPYDYLEKAESPEA